MLLDAAGVGGCRPALRPMTTSGYVPLTKWQRRRLHLRWAIADVFFTIGYRIHGDS